MTGIGFVLFFSSRRRHTRYWRDWSSDVCSSDLCGIADRRANSLSVGTLKRSMILLAEMDEEAPTLFGPPPPFPPKQVPQPTPMRSGFEPDPVGVRTDPFTRGLVPRLILALFRIRPNVRNEHGFRCNVRRVGAQRIRQPRR